MKPRPIVRIGNVLLHHGGYVEKISRWEQLLYKLGLKTTRRTQLSPRWWDERL